VSYTKLHISAQGQPDLETELQRIGKSPRFHSLQNEDKTVQQQWTFDDGDMHASERLTIGIMAEMVKGGSIYALSAKDELDEERMKYVVDKLHSPSPRTCLYDVLLSLYRKDEREAGDFFLAIKLTRAIWPKGARHRHDIGHSKTYDSIDSASKKNSA
jgi:hypothetical protein